MSRLYIAAFNRVADASGLAYWTDLYSKGVATLASIAGGFMGSVEGQQKYPVGISTGEFIDRIYQNVLGRVPDASGKAFWQTLFDAGAVSKSTFIDTVIQAAVSNGSNDGKILNNKATFGVNVALSGVDADSATAALSSITADTKSIVDAANVSLNLSFSTGQDNFIGGNGNDTFTATASTAQTTDSLSGGNGTDTLLLNTTLTLPQMSGIEIIKFQNSQSGSVFIGSSSGISKVYVISPVGSLNIETSASFIGYQNIGASLAQDILFGSSVSSAELALNGVGASGTNTTHLDIAKGAGLKAITISTTENASYMTLSNSALAPISTISIAGSKDLFLDITDSNIAVATTVDASSLTGNLTLTIDFLQNSKNKGIKIASKGI
jgi:hypothetical protein